MASTYLTRTVTSAGNRKTWTFSAWVKRCTTSDTAVGYDSIFSTNISNQGINIAFGNGAFSADGDYFEVTHAAASGGGTTDWSVRTNQLLRDSSGWYHLVVAFDTTQSTTADRVKIYVNGSEVDKTVTTGPALNTDYEVNNTQQHTIGRWQRDANSYLDGYLAHFHFIDGTAYDASAFGRTDSTTGIWVPKTAPSVTYGTNGFFLKFENSGAMGTDSSGNGNTWSVSGGTLTQTQDTPSNVFATLNSLWKENYSVGPITYSNGNTTYQPTINGSSFTRSTLGLSKGKYYIEMKVTEQNTGQSSSISITPADNYANSYTNSTDYGFQVQFNSSNTQFKKVVAGTVTTINSSFASGGIGMFAIDLDAGKMWVGYNGTWYNNNNESSTLDLNNPDATGIDTTIDYLIGFQAYWQTGGYYNIANVNFGNGYFGTTAVSSGNADDAGIGIFEYAVPSGFYALCTKNIASYG